MTFTKEQLIEKLQHRVAVTANYPDVEEAQLDAAIFKIALAALTAEPVAWISERNLKNLGKSYSVYVKHEPVMVRPIPLYTAPPAPASVPDQWSKSLQEMVDAMRQYEMDVDEDAPHKHRAMMRRAEELLANRAAMLQGAEPVTTANKLREGVAAIRNSGIAIDAEKIKAERDALNEPTCWCHNCRPVTVTDMRFVVCPDCGNKRCPHANDHRNTCTGSNEPGQEGSAYPAAPQQEVK